MGRDSESFDLIIRRMLRSDLDSVMYVEDKAHSFGWRRQTFIDGLRRNLECWVIDEPYNQTYTIAHAVLGFAGDIAELFNISVSPQWQSKGIGRVLLDHMLERSLLLPIQSVNLEVRASNSRAINLYESVGFKQIAVRKGYYRQTGSEREDALVLARPQIVRSLI